MEEIKTIKLAEGIELSLTSKQLEILKEKLNELEVKNCDGKCKCKKHNEEEIIPYFLGAYSFELVARIYWDISLTDLENLLAKLKFPPKVRDLVIEILNSFRESLIKSLEEGSGYYIDLCASETYAKVEEAKYLDMIETRYLYRLIGCWKSLFELEYKVQHFMYPYNRE